MREKERRRRERGRFVVGRGRREEVDGFDDGGKKTGKKPLRSSPPPLLVEKVLHVPVGDHHGLLEVVEHRCVELDEV